MWEYTGRRRRRRAGPARIREARARPLGSRRHDAPYAGRRVCVTRLGRMAGACNTQAPRAKCGPVAGTLVQLVCGYLGVGVLFALAFVTVGAARVEKTAAGGSPGFRVAIFPGAVVLWPYLLVRWLRAPKRTEKPS